MKIALLGDIALIGKYDLTKNAQAKISLKKMSEYLKQYDFVIGNLETPLTYKTNTLVCKSMHLKSPPENIELLKYLNINAVSLANNHSYDYGRKAIDDTIQILKENDISYFGIDGKNIILDNISISGFCCYTTNAYGYKKKKSEKGVNSLSFNEIIKQVEIDKKCNRLSLLSIHWGDEHTNYPRYDHIKFARLLTNKNDIILSGHHPHVIQGIESIKNSVIAYSQGNFCFDDCSAISGTGMQLKQNEENRESFILEVNIDKTNIITYKTIGIREINNEIDVDSVDEKLSTISSELRNITDIHEYEAKRIKQFSDPIFRENKFGKKNFGWFIKRLNYFAIGAFILAKINTIKYKTHFSSYLNK